MMTNNSRMWTLLAVLVLSIALGASPAIAQPVIEEVQVVDSTGDPLGLPEFLLIFGTGFGTISPTDTPVIFLGTEPSGVKLHVSLGASVWGSSLGRCIRHPSLPRNWVLS